MAELLSNVHAAGVYVICCVKYILVMCYVVMKKYIYPMGLSERKMSKKC